MADKTKRAFKAAKKNEQFKSEMIAADRDDVVENIFTASLWKRSLSDEIFIASAYCGWLVAKGRADEFYNI